MNALQQALANKMPPEDSARLDAEFDFALVGWSVYQPTRSKITRVYDFDDIVSYVIVKKSVTREAAQQIVYELGRLTPEQEGRVWPVLFVSRDQLTKETLLNGKL